MVQRKKLQELTIKDNFIFGAVMLDEENCRLFLELVLGFSIEKVTVIQEKSIIYHPEYKSIRLDIMARDEKHTRYNVEMQILKKKRPGRRSRYYHSQIDMEMLRCGEEYEKLPNAYVIFICDFDPFGKGKYRYSFQNGCREDAAIDLEDGAYTVFLSTCGCNDEEVPKELVTFLKYVGAGLEKSTEDFHNAYVSRLQRCVKSIKENREMEAQYMIFNLFIKEERDEAKAEGKVEGKAEGKAEAILELLEEACGAVPEELKAAILAERDPDVLTSYVKQAARITDVSQFQLIQTQL